MQHPRLLLTGLLLSFLMACSTTTEVSSRDVVVDQNYTGGAVNKVLVIAVLPDKNHDSRYILERSFAQSMNAAGHEAVASYTIFESLDNLTGEPEDFAPDLRERGIDAVLFLDPIRLDADFDPQEYDNRRTLWRELGMETTEAVEFWSRIAHESSASKVILNAGLWRPGAEKDLWKATYDIKAPMNYNVEAASEHSRVFAGKVITDLKAAGLL